MKVETDSMEIYIRVMAAIVPESVDALLKLIDEHRYAGCSEVHLLLSTPGGNVAQGISLANYLRGIATNINTYNFGAVDSIGVPVFAIGKRRYCSPQSRFLIHGVALAFLDKQTNDACSLTKKIEEITVDTRNIASLIAQATNRTPEQIIAAMNDETILDAEAAKEWGLVHEIRSMLVPEGARFCAIAPDYTVSQYITPQAALSS